MADNSKPQDDYLQPIHINHEPEYVDINGLYAETEERYDYPYSFGGVRFNNTDHKNVDSSNKQIDIPSPNQYLELKPAKSSFCTTKKRNIFIIVSVIAVVLVAGIVSLVVTFQGLNENETLITASPKIPTKGLNENETGITASPHIPTKGLNENEIEIPTKGLIENETESTTIPNLSTKAIAFSAVLNQTRQNAKRGDTIILDHVRSKIGDNYNPRTGVFTCTLSGLYFFAGNVLTLPGQGACFSIMKNGVTEIARPYTDSGNGTQAGADFTFVHLNVGDEITISTGCWPLSRLGLGQYSSFSGAFIETDIAFSVRRALNKANIPQILEVFNLEGQDYNSETGVFTCTSKGLYFFGGRLVNLYKHNQTAYFQILKNKSFEIARPHTSAELHEAAADVGFVQLDVGDKVSTNFQSFDYVSSYIGARIKSDTAFTAIFWNHQENLAYGQRLIFNKVKINLGNNYNARTGIFSCRTSGLYMFVGTALTLPGRKISCFSIMKNGNVELARPYTFGGNGYDSGSDFTFVHLEAGDTVSTSTNCTRQAGLAVDGFSSFSGALLKQD